MLDVGFVQAAVGGDEEDNPGPKLLVSIMLL
jgi:hypothetical protein